MKDKYTEHIEYLTANPDEKEKDWIAGKGIFAFCSPDGSNEFYAGVGCLSLVKCGVSYWVIDKEHKRNVELTERIRADERIPDAVNKIEPVHYPVFAEWQRIIDEEIRS